MPITIEYPKDKLGNPMILVAQINFSEIPQLENYPTDGILQFYISPTKWYDMDDYKIIFHQTIENEYQTDFTFLTEKLFEERKETIISQWGFECKCKLCELKTVLKGHREVCDKCAGELLICSKCIEPCEEYAQPTKSSKVLRNKPKDNTFEEILDMLKERQRRTILRKIEDGEDIVFDGNIGLVNKFTGEVVIELSQINNGVLNKNEEKENGEGDSIKEEDKEDNCKDNDEEDEDDQGDIDDEEEN